MLFTVLLVYIASSAYFTSVNIGEERWMSVTWRRFFFKEKTRFTLFLLFLLAGKTERGSYSSYGRESNLQGCHQVSENLALGKG